MSVAPDISVAIEEARAEPGARRTRARPQPIPLRASERQEVIDRVLRFLRQDEQARSTEKALRVQRYAKLMQYQSEVREPYPGASNVQLPDIMSAVLRTEDTLQNAAMSTRPMVQARATQPENRDRERKADLLLDHQFFLEQDGESLVEQASMNFVRDGYFVALAQWVREFRKMLYTRSFSPIPKGVAPQSYFRDILARCFTPGAWALDPESEGWDWTVRQRKQEYLVRFYTEADGDVTMQVEGDAETFCGPRALVYDYEDVLAPLWALNLQPPGPSNPHGAPHVIFVDYPTKDEVLRCIEQGHYDLGSAKDIDAEQGYRDWTDADREMDRQRRTLRGQDGEQLTDTETPEHNQLRRIICFDTWGGLDVVWTVIEASKGYLMRARPLTEVCPGIPIMRPIAHSCMLPVQGTWVGMGLPELMESMHDFMGETFNLMVDAANFEIYPFFFYRQASNLKDERVVLRPGGGIPVNDVQRDISLQRFSAQATQVGINMFSLANGEQERLISIGDLQLGRIPAGKSSALRTSGGIQQVLAQGEARPERILRRFFHGLTAIFRIMYRLDRHLLPEEKTFRVVGISQPAEEPFIQIDRQQDLTDAIFDFHANVLNSSKVALQQGLREVLSLTANPLMIQLGISTPATIYRTLVDLIRALGQNSDAYSQEPSPDAAEPPILAEEALTAILQGQIPAGPPAEGDFQAHLQRLAEILREPDESGATKLELLSMQERERVGLYVQQLQARAQLAQRQAALMAAAQQFEAGQQQTPEAGGSGKPSKPTMIERNDTADESLPSSGTPQ